MIANLLLGLAVLGGGLCAGSLAVSAILPASLRTLASWPPRASKRILSLLAILPWILAVGLLLVALLPALPETLGWWEDHCEAHQAHHPHICPLHPQELLHPARVAAPGLLFLGLAAWASMLLIKQVKRSDELAMGLLADSSGRLAGSEAHLVPGERAVALTAGFCDPRIFISERLATALDPEALTAVVAHERAHLAAGDTRWRTILQAATSPLLPGTRRALLSALHQAGERVADEDAAATLGDRLVVAEAILAVERLQAALPAAPIPMGCGFADEALAGRVEALLVPSVGRTAARPWILVVGLVSGGLVVAATPGIHHAIETAIGMLGG